MEQNNKPPFEGGTTKKKLSVIPGKHGAGYSTARHLARMAMQQVINKSPEMKKYTKKVEEAYKLPSASQNDHDHVKKQLSSVLGVRSSEEEKSSVPAVHRAIKKVSGINDTSTRRMSKAILRSLVQKHKIVVDKEHRQMLNQESVAATADTMKKKSDDHQTFYNFVSAKLKMGKPISSKEKDFLKAFKLMKKEEVEQVDEISSMAHARYRDAARKDVRANLKHTSGEYGDIASNIIQRRIKGLSTSTALQYRDSMKKKNVKEEVNESESHTSLTKYANIHAKEAEMAQHSKAKAHHQSAADYYSKAAEAAKKGKEDHAEYYQSKAEEHADTAEEYERSESTEVNEVSNELLQRYKQKAGAQVDNPKTPSSVKYKRGKGHLMATVKQMKSGKPMPPIQKEEVEEIDEATSAYGRINARFKSISGRTLGAAAKEHGDEVKKLQKEIEAQQKEIDRRKAAMKEEIEQIDELDKSTVKSYLKKKISKPGVPTQKDVDGIARATVRLMNKEEVEQIDEESLTAGKRLISKHGEGSHTARVYKDTEYNEYQVHHYKDGKHMGEGPVSYHDDKEDAEATAKQSIKRGMKEEVQQIDELKKSTLGSYINKASKKARINSMVAKDLEYKSKRAKTDSNKMAFDSIASDFKRKAWKRETGVAKAVDRLTKEETNMKSFQTLRQELVEKTLTPAEMKKREEVAKAIERDQPGMPMAKKMAIATATAKKVAEENLQDMHYCAKHVYSDVFGEGYVVEGEHAEPAEDGSIEWYSVQFDHGVEQVFTEDVQVMFAEYHMNHKRKKMGEMSSKEKMKKGLYDEKDVEEELTGNQHKIDMNKNNKIDAQDFHMLRKIKKNRMK